METEETERRDKSGRLIYPVDVRQRIDELFGSKVNISSTDSFQYEWNDGYEVLKYSLRGGGSIEYRGVHHPEDGLCVGEGICTYCGRTLFD